MTGEAASAHPSSGPSSITPPPPNRHPKHPSFLFAAHLSQTTEAANATTPPVQPPDAADAQSDFVHPHTHSDPALPDVAHSEPFDIQIHDHAHQDPPHLSDQPPAHQHQHSSHLSEQPVSELTSEIPPEIPPEMSPVIPPNTHDHMHVDHAQQVVDRAEEAALRAEELSRGMENGVNGVEPAPHQSIPATHISANPMNIDPAVDQVLHQASQLAQDTTVSTPDGDRPHSQTVHPSMHQSLERTVQQHVERENVNTGARASRVHLDRAAAAAGSASAALAEQMHPEETSDTQRVNQHNGGILQQLAAHVDTPKTKRARLMQQKSPAILARGASISLARRAAATAKKRRDEARAELERNGICEGVERALEGIVGISASTRANVSQNREKRVQRVKWRVEEVNALKKGVEKYGVGRWAVILREFATAFDPIRISVDLKDKWRNIYKVPKTRPQRPTVNVPPVQPNVQRGVLAGFVAEGIQQQGQSQPIHPKRELSVEGRGRENDLISQRDSQLYAHSQRNAQRLLVQHQAQTEGQHNDAGMTDMSQFAEQMQHSEAQQGRKRHRDEMLAVDEAISPSNSKNLHMEHHQHQGNVSVPDIQQAEADHGIGQFADEHVEQHAEHVDMKVEPTPEQQMETHAEQRGEHQVEQHEEQLMEQQQHDVMLPEQHELGERQHPEPLLHPSHMEHSHAEQREVGQGHAHEADENRLRNTGQHQEADAELPQLDEISVPPSEQPAEPLAEPERESLAEKHVNDQLEAEVNKRGGEAEHHDEELEKAREEEVKVLQRKLLDGAQHEASGDGEVEGVETAAEARVEEDIHSFRVLPLVD